MRIALCLITVLAVCSCAPKQTNPVGTDLLADAFRAANQSESVEPMLALYGLDGSDSSTIQLLKVALRSELRLPIASITFEPLSGAPEESITYHHNGQDYGPTLQPSYRMRVVYSTDDKFTSLYSIGQLPDGTWRIVSARPLNTESH